MEPNYQLILNFSAQSGIPVKKILDFLALLQNRGTIENRDLLLQLGLAKNALLQTKSALSTWLKPSKTHTQLNATGQAAVATILDGTYLDSNAQYSFLHTPTYQKLLHTLQSYAANMPGTERKYDQFIATRESVAARACLMDFLADVKGKSIAFLGDDDFTSLAVACMGSAKSVDVFDIDKRILGSIKDIAQGNAYPIQTHTYDARHTIPVQFRGKYDVVFTDPPYTPAGVSLFISRSIDLLDKNNASARLYTCYGNSDRAKERFMPIQRIITDASLLQRFVFEKFSRYFGAESIGSSSTLYVLETTSQTKPTIEGEFNEKIYTF